MAFPLLAAGALLAPLVGGAMSLAGGALSLTGGLTHAAATASGMAWDMGKGAMGALGGLGGGDNGKSGNVEEEETRASDPLGGKALPPGTKLNKNGVIVYDKGSSKGGQVLPGQFKDGQLMDLDERVDSIGPVDRSDASPLQRILDHVIHISANTDRMSVGIGLMVSGLATQQTQTATQTRDENLAGAETGGGKGPGRIARGISKGWGKVKDSLSSVGSGLKMALKALALGGIFILYKKYRTNIKEWMAGIFETFDGWYHDIKNSDDPWGTAFEKIKEMFEGWKIKAGILMDEAIVELKKLMNDTVIPKTMEIMDMIWGAMKEAVWTWMFGASGEKRIVQEAGTGSTATSNMAGVVSETSAKDIDTSSLYGTAKHGEDPLSKDQRSIVGRAYRDKIKAMVEISDQSDGRIQWTGINKDMSTFMSKISTLDHGEGFFQKLLPSEVMNANPIIDGHIFPNWDVLKTLKPGDLAKAGGITEQMSKTKKKEITSALAEKSKLVNEKLEWENATLGNEPGWQWVNNMKGPDKFEQRKANRLADIQKQIDANDALIEGVGQFFPDKDLQTKFFENAITKSNDHSIFTHDHNVIKLLEPVSKAFAERNQSSPVVVAPDNRNQSVTKLGDTYSGGLSSRVQDSTARMLAYTKNLNSTTGQFA